MTQFYGEAGSLIVEAYDLLNQSDRPQISGDIAFYRGLARAAGGPALEIACGTGRIALDLARDGIDTTGVDLSDGMLSIAMRKAEDLPADAAARLRLLRRDMRDLNLDRRFAFAFIPYRSFQHLLTPDDQIRTLASVRAYLNSGSRFAIHLFDPRLDFLIAGAELPPPVRRTDPDTGRTFQGALVHAEFDHYAQIRRDRWRYSELDRDGREIRSEERQMALRWTYRWELHHLLARCGFTVDAEHSDFSGGPPEYGKELVVVCRCT